MSFHICHPEKILIWKQSSDEFIRVDESSDNSNQLGCILLTLAINLRLSYIHNQVLPSSFEFSHNIDRNQNMGLLFAAVLSVLFSGCNFSVTKKSPDDLKGVSKIYYA